jgi:hypothetical protein
MGRFIVSPHFQALQAEFGKSALHVEDRVVALIRKRRLLHYPHGSSFQGNVEFSYYMHIPYTNECRGRSRI